MTQAGKSEVDLGEVRASREDCIAAGHAINRLNAAMPPGMDFQQFHKKGARLLAQCKWKEYIALCDAVDCEEFTEALLELRRVARALEWCVDDVRVPPEVFRQMHLAPARKRRALMEGVVAAFRGLIKMYPRFGRVLDTAVVRREEGQVFAEASRERRDELYRERVAWVAEKYQQVRGKYAPGVDGDKAARLEVAYAYAKVTGKKPMHDRSVRNILDAAAEVAARDHAETPS